MSVYECQMPYCRAEVYRIRDVCEPCWQDRRGQLEALPELYTMTYALLTPGSRLQEITTIQVNKPGSGVPFSLVVFDALEYAQNTLADWARWALARMGNRCRELRITGTTGRRFVYAVNILHEYDHLFINADYAGVYVLDVWTVYRRLAVQCLPTAPRNLRVPCPVCDHATVITRHADEYAACLTCASIWPHSQLSSLGKKVA